MEYKLVWRDVSINSKLFNYGYENDTTRQRNLNNPQSLPQMN